MAEFNEVENAERIAKLNAGAAKSDLPYHTDETEAIQAARTQFKEESKLESVVVVAEEKHDKPKVEPVRVEPVKPAETPKV